MTEPSTPISDGPDAAPDPLRTPFRIAGVVLLLLLAAYGVRCVRHGWWAPREPGASSKKARKHNRGTDFTAYYSAGELARRGKNIYGWRQSSTPRRPFIYPPAFALFPMAPLSLLPHNAALAVFFALNAALFLASLWLLRKLLWPGRFATPPPFWRRPEVGLLLATLVCGRFLDSNMVLGQANVMVLFLVTLGLYGLVRGRGFLGGLAVALATSYKLTPGLYGLYFLWSRRGWALAGGAAGLILFLVLLPSLYLGPTLNGSLLRAFAGHAAGKVGAPGLISPARDPASGQEISVGWGKKFEAKRASSRQAVGISLNGTLTKLLSPTRALPIHRPGETGRINIAALEPAQAQRIAALLALALLVITALVTGPRWTREQALAAALSWGLVGVTMLLISPLTRKAHGVVLVIPAATLVAMLQQERLKGLVRRGAWAALLLMGGAGLLTSRNVIGRSLSEHTHAAGIFTWTMLLLYVVLIAVLRSLKAAPEEEKPGRPER